MDQWRQEPGSVDKRPTLEAWMHSAQQKNRPSQMTTRRLKLSGAGAEAAAGAEGDGAELPVEAVAVAPGG